MRVKLVPIGTNGKSFALQTFNTEKSRHEYINEHGSPIIPGANSQKQAPGIKIFTGSEKKLRPKVNRFISKNTNLIWEQ